MAPKSPASPSKPKLVVENRPVLFPTPPDAPLLGRDQHDPSKAVEFKVTEQDLAHYAELSRAHHERFPSRIDVDHENHEFGKGPAKGEVLGPLYLSKALNPATGQEEPCLACDFATYDPQFAHEILTHQWEESSVAFDDTLFDVVGDIYPSWVTMLGNGRGAAHLPPTSEFIAFISPEVAETARHPVMLSRGAVDRLTRADSERGEPAMSGTATDTDKKYTAAEIEAMNKRIADAEAEKLAAEKERDEALRKQAESDQKAAEAEKKAEEALAISRENKEAREIETATEAVEKTVGSLLSRGLIQPATVKSPGFKELMVQHYRDRTIPGRSVLLSRGDGKDKKDETEPGWDVLVRALEAGLANGAVNLGKPLSKPAPTGPKAFNEEQFTKDLRERHPGISEDALKQAVQQYRDQLSMHESD